jgi:hypothetical protein
MTLPDTENRCLGMYTSLIGNTRCSKRDTCARYVQRYQGHAQTYQWLCPTPDEWYGAYVEQKEEQ